MTRPALHNFFYYKFVCDVVVDDGAGIAGGRVAGDVVDFENFTLRDDMFDIRIYVYFAALKFSTLDGAREQNTRINTFGFSNFNLFTI